MAPKQAPKPPLASWLLKIKRPGASTQADRAKPGVEKVAKIAKKNKRTRRGDGCAEVQRPKRPTTAYGYFVAEHLSSLRDVIAGNVPKEEGWKWKSAMDKDANAEAILLMRRLAGTAAKTRRGAMLKAVKMAWSPLKNSSALLRHYVALAAVDKARFEREMAGWNELELLPGDEAGEPGAQGVLIGMPDAKKRSANPFIQFCALHRPLLPHSLVLGEQNRRLGALWKAAPIAVKSECEELSRSGQDDDAGSTMATQYQENKARSFRRYMP